MSLNNWNQYKKLKLTLDTSTANLTNVPILLNISSSSGKNNFNCSEFFDELHYDGSWTVDNHPYRKKIAIEGPEYTVDNVDDNFTGTNGDDPNNNRWNVVVSGTNTCTIYNNKLKHDLDSGNDYCYVESKYNISGDFDIQIDIDVTGTPSSDSYLCGLSLKVDNTDPADFYQTGIRTNSSDRAYVFDVKTSGSWTNISTTTTTDTVSKVRLKRVGNITYSYYWQNNIWQENGSHNYGSAPDITVRVVCNSWNTKPAVTAYTDNFIINKGTIDWGSNTPYRTTHKQLYAELERWDQDNKSVQIWTKLPAVTSGTTTTLYLYYDKTQEDNPYIGNKGEYQAKKVWSAFSGVYTLSEDPSSTTTAKDSTYNVYNGTIYGNMTSNDIVDSLVGKGLDFDGSDDYIRIPKDLVNPDLSSFSVITKTTDGGVLIGRGGDGESVETNLVQLKLYTQTNNPPSRYFFETGGGTNHTVDLSTVYSDNNFHHVHLDIINDGVKVYKDGSLTETHTGVGNSDTTAPDSFIAYNGAGNNEYFKGVIDTVFFYDYTPSSDFVNYLYKSSHDNLITYDYYSRLFFVNSNPNNKKVYGTSQILKTTLTYSGSDIYGSTYNTEFYKYPNILVDTVSGTIMKEEVFGIIDTLSGTNYKWFAKATTLSGYTAETDLMSFDVRYLCSGICYDGSMNTLSGVKVNLHLRSGGQLIGSTTTAGSGVFQIESSYNEYHYAVALHPSTNYNALIYDYIKP